MLALALSALTAAGWSAAGTGVLLRWLIARGRLDHPNQRSSHATAKPRGAGPALVSAMIVAVLVFGAAPSLDEAALMLGLIVLCALGFIDDRQSLSAGLRLAVQALVTAIIVLAIGPFDLTGGLCPYALQALIIGIGLMWMINLTNFMDGIDGITGAHHGVTGLGAALILVLLGAEDAAVWPAALAGASLGFLTWNWPPSKIFMGDSGSLPIGLIAGVIGLTLALHGAWASALILNASYLADSGITLTRRALRGETIWQAHRQHAYQRLTQSLGSHGRALGVLIALDLWLLVLAVLALDPERAPFAAGAALVIVALYLGVVERVAPVKRR